MATSNSNHESKIENHAGIDIALSQLKHLAPDAFELCLARTSRTQIEAKEGRVETLTRAEDIGLAVRVIKNQRMGFSFTTSIEKQAIERAVQMALEIAQEMPEDRFNTLGLFEKENYKTLSQVDYEGLALPPEKKVERALELESLCRKQDQRIKNIRSAAISETFSETCLIDSKGKRIASVEGLYSASISCKAEQDGDSQMGGDYGFHQTFSKLDIETVAKNAAETATELLGAKAAPTLKCPAILRNSVVAELIEFLSSSFSAEQIDKGRSLLKDREGQIIFSDRIDLIDDGLLAGGLATSPFDGEGVPSQKNQLVTKGVFTQALYDRYYALKLGKKPSGVSGRRIKSLPSIGVTNLYVPNGNTSIDKLKGSISRGVLITDLMGIHTANPITGDFSLGASGFLIEKGQITNPIKGFAVAGNLLELFKRITDIGNDQRFFGNVGAPSVLVSELSVGGS